MHSCNNRIFAINIYSVFDRPFFQLWYYISCDGNVVQINDIRVWNASWEITAKNVDFKISLELFANYCWKFILLIHFIYKVKRFYLQCIQSCQKSACWSCCWNCLFYPWSYQMIMQPGFELNNSNLAWKERSRYMK